jgi:phosphoesterase RecJ-like protein
MSPEEAARLLAAQDRILLVTHLNPDGDTMGSAAALCSALRRSGKTAFLWPNPQVIAKLLPFVEPWYAPADFVPEYVVSVDVATEKMFAVGFAGAVDLCIDHHPSNSHYAAAECIDPARAATGELVLRIIRALCGDLTKDEADLLYIALTTDCGCFQYANTDATALRDAAELLGAGADNAALNLLFFRKVSAARLKLEGLIYQNMSFHRDGKVVVALVTDEMLAAAGATEDDCDDLAGLAGRAECGEVSITIRDWPGGASKVSVRSQDSFDSCALCARFGGGGHKMAAGCNIPVPPQKARELLLRAIDEVLA